MEATTGENKDHTHAGMNMIPTYSYIPTTKPIVSSTEPSQSAYLPTAAPTFNSNHLKHQPQHLHQHHHHHQQQQQQQQQQQDNSQPRKRTRATPEQLSILEKTFSVNPSPNNRVREQLSRNLGMSERSIQIWFQNRRAKVKNMAKRSSLLHDETLRMQYYAATAAAAACQAASLHQQQNSPDSTSVSNPDLYYYYYYYYYNQQQQLQQQQQQQQFYPGSTNPSSMVPPPNGLKPPTSSSHTTPPPPPPPMPTANGHPQIKPWESLTTPPPSSISPSMSAPTFHYRSGTSPTSTPTPSTSTSTNLNNNNLSPTPTPTSSTTSSSSATNAAAVTAGGRVRAHSVGHYPYNPYQRHPSRHGSMEPSTVYNHRRYYSSSASPAPQCPPPPPPMNAWAAHPSASSSFMLNPNTMIPEEADGSTLDPFQADHHGYYSHWSNNMMQMSMPFMQDDRLGTPMSLDGMTTIEDDEPYHFSAEALQIGTWKRMSLKPKDLECFFDKQIQSMVWRITDGQQRFKMHIGLDSIEKIQLDPLLERLGWARLTISVSLPENISFYMEDHQQQQQSGSQGEYWTQCRDFTQDRQATSVQIHYIDGPALALRAEWIRLVSQDQQLNQLFKNNMIQPIQHQQQMVENQATSNNNNNTHMYDTALGPHGQSMLSNASDVTPNDVLDVLHNHPENESMLSLMEKDQDKDQQNTQDLLLFQGV